MTELCVYTLQHVFEMSAANDAKAKLTVKERSNF